METQLTAKVIETSGAMPELNLAFAFGLAIAFAGISIIFKNQNARLHQKYNKLYRLYVKRGALE